ncbi:efflux RND transporter permease subunit [Haladaptatus salinisoli]|uniref:efflux RND transporter permease subunit n=1 Tax=Haladaptatus salinisoli TaxID=2884876 RepID=UPI001D0B6BD6|nr:MMPL family transporter [Haladaptatus salinisoli]
MVRYQAVIDRLDEWIVGRSRAVLLVFLVLTAGFGVGATRVSTEAGTSQFTEDTPAQEAFDAVEREFTPPFAAENGSTQLIQTGRNVLSKPELLAMLEAQHRLEQREELRVGSTVSAAAIVARTLDPNATTLEAQIRALERATPTEIEIAVRRAATNPEFRTLLSDDFNPRAASASATVGIVEHRIPRGIPDQAGAEASGEDPLAEIQSRAQSVVGTVDSDIRVFGSGIVTSELSSVVFDSLVIVVPAAAVLILVFLVFAYRDPVDLLLGVASLVMTVVWTLGFMGIVGIPFTQLLVAVPPLLLAVGIDYGIHVINRYREERIEDGASEGGVGRAMRRATDQLLVAFFVVTGTTVLGFASNVTSRLQPIREFGVVAAVGIVFTLLIFGIFLPAAKVAADRLRARLGVPAFGDRPLGEEGSLLGRTLQGSVALARRSAGSVLVVAFVLTVASGYYATGIDTSFSNEDFLPPEETPAYLESLPEPLAPETYTVTRTIEFLDENFATAEDDAVTVFVEGPLEEDYALESFQQANRNPPASFVADERRASAESIVTVIQEYGEQSEAFRRLVERNDIDGDGVPDDDLETVYDRLLSSPARGQALQYISDDRRSAQVVYATKSGASQEAITRDARAVAERYRFDATATGEIVVFQSIAALIFASAVRSLAVALIATAVFLAVVYRVLAGRAAFGVVNLVPIIVSVALLAGTMRLLGIPFNALTATVLAIALGLGIDYSAHVVQRFTDEYDARGEHEERGVREEREEHAERDGETEVFDALSRTVRGTGGALTGSMLTTVAGTGILVLAITPVLGQFGLVTALSIFYSYLTALLVTPAVIVAWATLSRSASARRDRT